MTIDSKQKDLDLLIDFALKDGETVHYLATAGRTQTLQFIGDGIKTLTGHGPNKFISNSGLMRSLVRKEDLPEFDKGAKLKPSDGLVVREYRLSPRKGDHMRVRDECRVVVKNRKKYLVGRLAPVPRGNDKDSLYQYLEDAISVLPSGFAVYGADGRLAVANEAISRAYGFKNEELTGMHRLDLFASMTPQIDLFDGKRIKGTKKDAREIDRLLHALGDGTIEVRLKNGRWRLLTCHPTHDGGQVIVATDITTVKQAETELRQSESLVRNVLEACPLPILMANAEGDVLYESPSSRANFGTSKKAENRSVEQYYADLADRKKIVAALRKRGGINDIECLFQRADGSYFPAAVSSKRIEYLGQETFVSTIVDLTEQKSRETELTRARELLSEAIEALEEGFALFDRKDRLILCNSKYLDFNPTISKLIKPGAKGEDLQALAVERGQYPDMIGRAEDWAKKRRDLFASKSKSVVLKQSDGRWFESSVHPTRSGQRLFFKRDITDHKEMEAAIRESEASVRRVLENCPLPITLSRLHDGEILYESPASEKLFFHEGGKEVETVLPRWLDLADRDKYVEQLKKSGSVDNMELQFKKPDGSIFWGALSSRLLEYIGEDYVVSCCIDLTDRKALDDELGRQRDTLHQTEKLSALGELLAGVSHELNNPLSVLVGQSLLLKETARDPVIVERAEKIGNAADRCARIVKSFLAMARQEPLESRDVSINSIVESALDVTAYALRVANIEVDLNLTEDLPQVFGDPDQLGQVITNLIVNAQHALEGADGPRILLLETGLNDTEDTVFARVSDNGPGIPEELENRIFEPLFTTKEVGSGTGIGLALCHRIVETHGGTIALEKDTAAGASFVISLPLADGAALKTIETAHTNAKEPRLSVLVVDDESDVASLICDILETDGHSTQNAQSGLEALTLIAAEEFDVILSDLRMPDLDGPGLYRQLAHDWPEMAQRMAFITGDTLGQSSAEFLKEVGRPFLEKPITPSDVRALIRKLRTPDIVF
jgi:PAS domain S-box-containing protein